MAMTLKALSALLNYPTEDLVTALPEIATAIADEDLVPPTARRALDRLVAELGGGDIYDLQERYVDLFDRGRRLSLHLFEHVHGESRDRGQAMVDLASLYERAGLAISANEMPDFLPLFLEYLSTRPLAEARDLIGETAHILALLEERLGAHGSAYAAVFAALLGIAGRQAAALPAPELVEGGEDLAALDAEWEETAVTFGPGDAMGGCSVDRLQTTMRAARRDARQTNA